MRVLTSSGSSASSEEESSGVSISASVSVISTTSVVVSSSLASLWTTGKTDEKKGMADRDGTRFQFQTPRFRPPPG